MSTRRYYQAFLFGGVAVAIAGAFALRLPFVFVGLIAALMGSAGLGIFPRKRLVSAEQQKTVRQLSTYVNAGAPIAAVSVALLGGNETVFSVVLGVTLALDVAVYLWISRMGQSWRADLDGTEARR